MRGRLVVRIGLGLEELNDPMPARRRISRVEAGGKRLGGGVAAQSQCLCAPQKRVYGSSESGPKLNLARDGAFDHLAG